MLMKRIGRMKQKKGAVLFAVIAVMALLITMASTAYYTARSAYNSVVSNYNYSQLYLSAISVSDMVASAVGNDPIGSANGVGVNNYQPLRDAVLTMETIGDKITASSQNISTPSASDETILSQLVNADSIISGVIDGVKIEIELKDNTQQYSAPVAGPDTSLGQYTFFFKYEYTFTTTAYYRNNTISVQGSIMTVKSKVWTPDPGSPGTPPTPPTPGPGGGLFDRYFTSTGQVIGENNGGTGIVRTSRIVEIKAHQINDDAFYQNDHTFFVNGNNNTFLGSVTSTGSIYLDKFTTNIQGSGNDWYIGGDFVMLGSNANSFDLNNNNQYDNNLYVGGDLVLSGDGAQITATDIYVEGDLYIISHGSPTINGNLHVTGNIYYQMGDTVLDEDGNPVASALANATTEGYPPKYDSADSNDTFKVSGDFDCNGTLFLPNGTPVTDTATITVNGGTSNSISSGASASTAGNAIGTFNADDIQVTVTNRVPNSTSDSFETVTNNTSVSGAIEQQAGENVVYENYTSPATAYANVLTIDFSLLSEIDTDGDDVTDYWGYTGPNGLTIRTATSSPSSVVTVDIPYNANGCALNIVASSVSSIGGGSAQIVYNIHTEDASGTAGTMPVVLLPNILVDANPDDTDTTADDPAFAWQGTNYNNNGSWGQVVAVGDGNVTLEMANYDPSTLTQVQVGEVGTGQWAQDAEGEWFEIMQPVYAPSATYAPYNYNNYATTATALYIAGYKEVVGNAAQIGVIGTDGNMSDSKAATMCQPGTNTPLPQYENQFMLISNANNAIAIDMTRIQNTFCGFIYAPNGEVNNKELAGGTNPLFGAMICSTYRAGTSYIYYAEPKPSRISAMTGSLTGGKPGGGTPGTPGTPPTAPPGTGTYSSPSHVDIWDVAGSNYIG